MEKNRDNPRRGVIFIDIAAAVVVFVIGVLILWGLFPRVFNMGESSRAEACTVQLAQSKMEELLSENKFIGSEPRQDFPPELGKTPDGKPTGYRKWWGEPDPSGISGTQRINVEVVWIRGNQVKRYLLTGTIAP